MPLAAALNELLSPPPRALLPLVVDGGVVFSHGIGGSRRGYSYLGQHWASHGLASVHLQHIGSDRDVWFGSPLGMIGRLQDAAQDGEAIARAQNLRFALDQLLGPGSEFAPRIDAERIAAAGHSYGANTVLLAAGARVQRQGRLVDLREARLQAAIVLSAPPFYGEPDPATILAPVTVPTLHVTATGDVIRIPGYYSGAEDRVAVFAATGSAAKALAVFDGGSHSMFTDLPAPGDPGEIRQNQTIARAEAGSAPGRTITSWREAAHQGEVQRKAQFAVLIDMPMADAWRTLGVSSPSCRSDPLPWTKATSQRSPSNRRKLLPRQVHPVPSSARPDSSTTSLPVASSCRRFPASCSA